MFEEWYRRPATTKKDQESNVMGEFHRLLDLLCALISLWQQDSHETLGAGKSIASA
jgi:hypothetical protein